MTGQDWRARAPVLVGLAMTAALAAGGRFGRRAALRSAGVALASQALTRLTNSRLLPGEARAAATSAFAAGAGLELPWAGGLLGAGAVLVSLADVRAGRTRPAVALGASCIGAAVALGSTRVWPVAPREPADLRPAGGARRHRAANDGESVAVVLNPGAGSESGDSPADHLRQALPAARVVELDEGDDLLDAFEEAAAGAGVLGAMGGDGTLNAAAGISHERGIPLLAIPGGTLNHFARDAGLESADDALAALAAGEVVAVDLASIDGHCFLNTASFGAYTELVDGRERLEGRIGKWPAMVTALVQVLRRSQPTEVEIDGRRRRLWLVFVGNCTYHPHGFAPSWRARLDDGQLDVRLVDASMAGARVRLVIAVLTGRLGRCRAYEEWTTNELHVRRLDGDRRLARDGETFEGSADFAISKCDEPLLVYSPHK
ncbi:hypothetical protein BH20ACT1_BH20ACT1_05040 [soil metagenome]